MDISKDSPMNTQCLDHIARHALGQAISGVSVGGGSARIHFLLDSPDSQSIGRDILNNFGSLRLTASISRLTTADPHPTIHCGDPAISSDSELGYLILLDGAPQSSGTQSLSAGRFTLTISTASPGTYEAFVFRLRDSRASASIHITVDES